MFCIPFHLTTEVFDNFVFGSTIFGKLACNFPPTIYYTCDWVSILSVFTMALNRFIVLICPLRKSKLRQNISKWRTNLVLIGMVWAVSGAISLPNMIYLKLKSICDLLEKTRYYPTHHGTQNHVHWNQLGNLPCTEDFDFDEKLKEHYQDSNDYRDTTFQNYYINPPEIEQKFTIKNWLDSTINSKNPHENERAYYMLSTLLQCWSLNDILTCTWHDEDAKLKYQLVLLSIWFSVTAFIVIMYGLIALEMCTKTTSIERDDEEISSTSTNCNRKVSVSQRPKQGNNIVDKSLKVVSSKTASSRKMSIISSRNSMRGFSSNAVFTPHDHVGSCKFMQGLRGTTTFE